MNVSEKLLYIWHITLNSQVLHNTLCPCKGPPELSTHKDKAYTRLHYFYAKKTITKMLHFLEYPKYALSINEIYFSWSIKKFACKISFKWNSFLPSKTLDLVLHLLCRRNTFKETSLDEVSNVKQFSLLKGMKIIKV